MNYLNPPSNAHCDDTENPQNDSVTLQDALLQYVGNKIESQMGLSTKRL